MYTKEKAIKIITTCAKIYDKELCNRCLLFVCADKHKNVSYMEFTFKERNFLHLTGVCLVNKTKTETGNFSADEKINISAVEFYEKCLSGKLSPKDFEFSEEGTTQLKLDVLPYVLTKNLSANMIGDFNSNRPKLYTQKLVGGSKACIGFVLDEKKNLYVPNTILNCDLRDEVSGYVRIIETYRKYFDECVYNEIVYKAKKVDWDRIIYPDELTSKLLTT